MPITLKTNKMHIRGDSNSSYITVDALTDNTTEERIEEINALVDEKLDNINDIATSTEEELTTAAQTAKTEINTAAAAARASIPLEYTELFDEVNHKADIDGNYNTMTVGNADQLVATVGIEDKAPYNFRTAGGSIDIGDREEDKIVGGTVVWNQLIKNGNFETTNNWSKSTAVTYSASGNVMTITKPAGQAYGTGYAYQRVALTSGHKYFYRVDYKNVENTTIIRLFNLTSSIHISDMDWHTATFIHNFTGTSGFINMMLWNMSENANADMVMQVRNCMVIDLTQMFGSTIADYIYSLEQANAGAGVAWFRKLFPNTYYAYNAGELMSVQAAAHSMVGFNAYDHTAGTAKLVGGMQYQITGAYTTLAYADLGGGSETITPDTDRYFTPANSGVLTVTGGDDTTTCVHLVWDGERDGEFEAYVKYEYPLDDSLTLRGIPVLDVNNNLSYLGDTYESDGTVTRRAVQVTFDGSSDESWTQSATAGEGKDSRYLIMPVGAYGTIIEDKFISNLYAKAISGGSNTEIGIQTMNSSARNLAQIIVRPENVAEMTITEFRALLAKKPLTVVYILSDAVATTESAAPYQNPQIVDDFGTEEYVDAGVTASTPTRDVAIPVGHETTYRANLRAKLEMAPDSPDSDGDYVVRHTNGQNNYVQVNFSVDNIGEDVADLADKVEATQELVAPIEVSPSANAYNIGEYLIYNDTLYCVTAAIAVGDTLTVGTNIAAAPNGVAGELTELKSAMEKLDPGLSDEAKSALLNLVRHVAYIDDQGQSYYDALYAALNSKTNLASIAAVFAPTNTLYEYTALDDLREYLTVTAQYSDGSTRNVQTYTLSGTLNAGTNIVTVAYGSCTTTFSVTISSDAWYKLPAAKTFNGTSDYVDTGIKLGQTDVDFTIMITGEYISRYTTTGGSNLNGSLFHCMHEEEPWPGYYGVIQSRADLTQIQGCQNDVRRSVLTNAVYFPFQYAFRHKAGSGMIDVTVTVNGVQSTNYVKQNDPCEFVAVTENLLIGAYQNTSGVKNRWFKGTMTDFRLYREYRSNASLNEYFGAEMSYDTNGLMYTLPAPVTLNGTTDYIDTGIKVLNFNRDYSILVELTDENPTSISGTSADYTIFSNIALQQAGSTMIERGSQAVRRTGAGDSVYRTLNFKRSINQSAAGVQTGDTIRYAMVNQCQSRGDIIGNATRIVKIADNGTLIEIRDTRDENYGFTWTEATNLLFGATDSNGTKSRFWKGTIKKAYVYYRMLTEAEVDAFIEGGTPA